MNCSHLNSCAAAAAEPLKAEAVGGAAEPLKAEAVGGAPPDVVRGGGTAAREGGERAVLRLAAIGAAREWVNGAPSADSFYGEKWPERGGANAPVGGGESAAPEGDGEGAVGTWVRE